MIMGILSGIFKSRDKPNKRELKRKVHKTK